jgi:adenosylhomocysteine nucleosidase
MELVGAISRKDEFVMRSQADVRIAILAPMRSELKPLMRVLSLKPSRTGDRSLLSCAFGRAEIVATTTGIGTRAAARKAEMLLDDSPIDHLVVVGIAGGIGPSVAIGDLVVPELVIDLSTCVEYRPSILGSTAVRGKLVTSDEVPIDLAEVDRLERQGVIAVDMETAAIAAVCERRRCPWSVFRAISDRADDGSTDAAVLGLAGPDGEANLPAVLRFVLTNPKRVPQLARLARGSNLAANVAASAAIRALREMYAT